MNFKPAIRSYIQDVLQVRSDAGMLPNGEAPIVWRMGPALAVMVLGVILCGTMMTLKSEAHHPDAGDAREYLLLAYNVIDDGVYTELAADPPVPMVSREPGYPALLMVSFLLDPNFSAVDRTCLAARRGCPPEAYAVAQWVNRLLSAGAGLIVFAIGTLVTRHWIGGAVAGTAIWINSRLLKDLNYIISDALALFLAALLILMLLLAWRRKSPALWFAAGLSLAALALTKAVFLYYTMVLLPVLLIAAYRSVRTRPGSAPTMLLCACLFFTAFAGPTGAWMTRNHGVGGEYTITGPGRASLSLSTREIFNDFTPTQYAAAFVHWTRGFGDNLARALFEPAVWKPFELDNPNGFYNRAVRRMSERVGTLRQKENVPRGEAYTIFKNEMISAILSRPVVHLLTTIPVVYRGIWADEFAFLSFPLLIVCCWLAVRRHRWDILLILSPGLFNLLFYALVSFNLPRYQTTAAPDLTLSLAIGALSLLAYLARMPKKPG